LKRKAVRLLAGRFFCSVCPEGFSVYRVATRFLASILEQGLRPVQKHDFSMFTSAQIRKSRYPAVSAMEKSWF
jgi:hypothetical protein